MDKCILPFYQGRVGKAQQKVNWGLLIIKLIIMIIKLTMIIIIKLLIIKLIIMISKLTMIMIMVITMRRMGLTLITIMISPMIVDPCWPKDGNEQR